MKHNGDDRLESAILRRQHLCPNCLKPLIQLDFEDTKSLFYCGSCGKAYQMKLVEVQKEVLG